MIDEQLGLEAENAARRSQDNTICASDTYLPYTTDPTTNMLSAEPYLILY
jgi:hypothetical protein